MIKNNPRPTRNAFFPPRQKTDSGYSFFQKRTGSFLEHVSNKSVQPLVSARASKEKHRERIESESFALIFRDTLCQINQLKFEPSSPKAIGEIPTITADVVRIVFIRL